MSKPRRVRFQEAQERAQCGNADRKWIEDLERQRLTAHVTRGTLGDREVRLSRYDATAVGAFRHCREGSTRSTWDAGRGVVFVPASLWRCVARLLRDAGVEIREG